ncbi:putative receptor-like protein kinase [Senna tora]|uniref:Putative receptor-like protein kinase n=1 Tax=Senna tora TaxID=362788 RepID=A0A834XA04_9FABA|nr:putative receptor-like protein kinase [Senna tora]
MGLQIVKQIEYYFSDENLSDDFYLRGKMDGQGWVHIDVIAEFRRVKSLTSNVHYILDVLYRSSVLHVRGYKVRLLVFSDSNSIVLLLTQEDDEEIMIERKPGSLLRNLLSSLPLMMLSPSMVILLVITLLSFSSPAFSQTTPSSPSSSSSSSSTFTPKDNFLIDCGSDNTPNLPDGRQFQSDPQARSFLQAKDDHKVSSNEANVPSPIYSSARIFKEAATYSFNLSQPGFHWVRLHFYPVKNDVFDLQQATFSVNTDQHVLLHNFNVNNNSDPILKEYLINATQANLAIWFLPLKSSAAFVNAIEIVSAPDILIADKGSALFPVGEFTGLTSYAFQPVYRLNNGGPLVNSVNDTLGRIWVSDQPYLTNNNTAKTVSIAPNAIKFPSEHPLISPLIAPPNVYSSATEMGDSMNNPNFNISWKFPVDSSFTYLVRLHFCDIASRGLNELYFNVYVNQKMAIPNLDLSAITGALAVPYYKDIVVDASLIPEGLLKVEIGPTKMDGGNPNAIMNGIEVMKMSNSVKSLDGEFGVDGSTTNGGPNKGAVAAVGFAMMFGAFVGLGAMVIKWHKRPQDWERKKSFSSWLLPLHAGDGTFTSDSKTSSGSHLFSSSAGLGRSFSLSELQEATKNWDPKTIIGVGGFGNVYLCVIDEGTQVAVKRGNPQSEQGITEFQTEIQMLSKLRHRHLVSLIGYCDENEEMILVYEYMSNGPFRDHLYGKDLPTLSWKQRLEICIGAARGLHYLHTGTAQGIIHRDVKTTNILLDESFTAKVADFGLSKDGPMGQGHVSTAVKGSFGYLDPEYFKMQQLTAKSDVYSFGVVLLEALCARAPLKPQLPREQVNLADWAMQCQKKDMIEKIIDPALGESVCPESVKKFAEAAEKCLADYGVDRPSMGDVLWNLENALRLQEEFLERNNVKVEIESENETKPPPPPLSPSSSSSSSSPSVSASNDQPSTTVIPQLSNVTGSFRSCSAKDRVIVESAESPATSELSESFRFFPAGTMSISSASPSSTGSIDVSEVPAPFPIIDLSSFSAVDGVSIVPPVTGEGSSASTCKEEVNTLNPITLIASMTISPAMIAFVVATACTMLPAIPLASKMLWRGIPNEAARMLAAAVTNSTASCLSDSRNIREFSIRLQISWGFLMPKDAMADTAGPIPPSVARLLSIFPFCGRSSSDRTSLLYIGFGLFRFFHVSSLDKANSMLYPNT